MDYPIISFTSNNPTTTCMGTHVSFRKLITSAKVSTPPQDIHTNQKHYIKIHQQTIIDNKKIPNIIYRQVVVKFSSHNLCFYINKL